MFISKRFGMFQSELNMDFKEQSETSLNKYEYFLKTFLVLMKLHSKFSASLRICQNFSKFIGHCISLRF